MNINFSDPVLLICAGVIMIGIVYLVWAIGKWRESGARWSMLRARQVLHHARR